MDLCWAYTIVRNEAKMLPWWLRYYGSFCEHLVVYDDASDDGTPELARAAGAEVRGLPWSGLDDGESVRFAEWVYPEARGLAHWVMWVDADELVVDGQAPIEDVLGEMCSRTPRVQLPKVQGLQMYASEFHAASEWPMTQLHELVRRGVPDENYSKAVVFDPDLELSFGVGRHSTGGAPLQPSTLKLLHFRFMGRAYYLERSRRNHARLSARAFDSRWGAATYPENVEREADMNEAAMQHATEVI